MGEKVLRLVALDASDNERGDIDGEELTISVTVDGELQVTTGQQSLFGPGLISYGWEDLVPDYRRGEKIRLELQIVDKDA